MNVTNNGDVLLSFEIQQATSRSNYKMAPFFLLSVSSRKFAKACERSDSKQQQQRLFRATKRRERAQTEKLNYN